MVRRMRTFAVASDMGRVGSGGSQFVSGLTAWYALLVWNSDKDGGVFPVVQPLANRLGVMCGTLNSFK